jgi:hypothetical protein
MIVLNHGSTALKHFIMRGETKPDKATAATPIVYVVYLASGLLLSNPHCHVITPLLLPLSLSIYEEKREKSKEEGNCCG